MSHETQEAGVLRSTWLSPYYMDQARETAKFIDQHWQRYHLAPSLREISKKLGYSSPSSASHITNTMVARGWLHHERYERADYELTQFGRYQLLGEDPEVPEVETEPDPEPVQEDPSVEAWKQATAESLEAQAQMWVAVATTGGLMEELINRGYIVLRKELI